MMSSFQSVWRWTVGRADGGKVLASRVLSESAVVPVTVEWERPAWRVHRRGRIPRDVKFRRRPGSDQACTGRAPATPAFVIGGCRRCGGRPAPSRQRPSPRRWASRRGSGSSSNHIAPPWWRGPERPLVILWFEGSARADRAGFAEGWPGPGGSPVGPLGRAGAWAVLRNRPVPCQRPVGMPSPGRRWRRSGMPRFLGSGRSRPSSRYALRRLLSQCVSARAAVYG
jgi:hypothetical protein